MMICAADSIILMFLFSCYFFVLFLLLAGIMQLRQAQRTGKDSRRGRRRLRYLLFQVTKPAVLYAGGFRQLHKKKQHHPLGKAAPKQMKAGR